jgi:hypothetical protein
MAPLVKEAEAAIATGRDAPTTDCMALAATLPAEEHPTMKRKGRPRNRPRSWSTDNISLHQSSMPGGIPARIAESLFQLWVKIRKAYTRLRDLLFPRRPIIHGRTFDSSIVGRITFSQKLRDDRVPIHNMRVELWGRTWLAQYRKLGDAFTDENGEFNIRYDLRCAHGWGMHSIAFEIHNAGQRIYKPDGSFTRDYTLFKSKRIAKSDLVGMQFSVGTIQLFYWEYVADSPIPRVYFTDYYTDAPEQYAQGRLDYVYGVLIPYEVTMLELLEQIRIAPGSLSIADIQSSYPPNLTILMERKYPGITRGDDWFGCRMMNGTYASRFFGTPAADPHQPQRLYVHYHFGPYEKNDEYALPDVEITFELKDELPVPVEIKLTGRLSVYDHDPKKVHRFTPSDGDAWLQAKRVARVVGTLSSELDDHFSATHVNTEQYAIAAFRNMRLNPVAGLLFPHLKEVSLIDHTSDAILLNQGFITQSSALTPKAITDRVHDILGTCDWKNWRPMQPVSTKHYFALIANLYFDIVSEYVTEFLQREKECIQQYWYEIYCFSHDLVNHSVPFYACSYLRMNAMDRGDGETEGGDLAWYTHRGSMDLTISRPIVDGVVRAVSPITTNKTFGSDEDWRNLHEACTYAIYNATFAHTWANIHQFQDFGEILYNGLGLRFGPSKKGVMEPESDLHIAPDHTHAIQQLFLANMLSRGAYGFITKNEERDIDPRFVELLEARRGEFAQWYFDIDVIQSRINV